MARDAVPNNDPVILPAVTERLPDVNIDPVNIKVSAFVNKEPVIVWFPLNVLLPVVANVVEFMPSNMSAFNAYDALATVVVTNDAVSANEDVVALEDETVNDDVVATELDTALLAQLDVPIKLPRYDPVNDPFTLPVTVSPASI